MIEFFRAVWIMFLSFTALVAVTLGYMVTGSVSDRVICKGLKKPYNTSTFELLDDLVDLSSIYTSSKKLNLSTIIRYLDSLILFLYSNVLQFNLLFIYL